MTTLIESRKQATISTIITKQQAIHVKDNSEQTITHTDGGYTLTVKVMYAFNYIGIDVMVLLAIIVSFRTLKIQNIIDIIKQKLQLVELLTTAEVSI